MNLRTNNDINEYNKKYNSLNFTRINCTVHYLKRIVRVTS